VVVRVRLAGWLSVALRVLADLERIGYRVTDDEVDRLIESAVIIEVP
jgi:hypothetical protein